MCDEISAGGFRVTLGGAQYAAMDDRAERAAVEEHRAHAYANPCCRTWRDTGMGARHSEDCEVTKNARKFGIPIDTRGPEADEPADQIEVEVVTERSSLAGIRGRATGLIEKLISWAAYGPEGTIRRKERKTWAAASSLTDLCGLTERWLTGELKSQPGYYGSVDVDEEDAPGMTESLIALNRAGFLTDNSQAGADLIEWDGAHWTQLASVDGYATAETVVKLRDQLEGTPYVVKVFGRPGHSDFGAIVDVTWIDGDSHTRFGGGMAASDIRFAYQGAGTQAVEEVVDALQVVVYDPTPGRNGLWAALRNVTR